MVNNSRLVVLEECGHYAYIEKPVEFTKAVRDFIQSQ